MRWMKWMSGMRQSILDLSLACGSVPAMLTSLGYSCLDGWQSMGKRRQRRERKKKKKKKSCMKIHARCECVPAAPIFFFFFFPYYLFLNSPSLALLCLTFSALFFPLFREDTRGQTLFPSSRQPSILSFH
ncbi:hypothetical protein M440DRAFT_85445 [Trichoderma longibrachiatum ATCC 18648]|uniref:Uncharacterized protein n=1 Tax=Trichoderma longibrachiatum ATCC 18648 TaxID=983965 RepID=A0A2T4CIT2_TRILO|nr:hypothetical protein M440DRAFT_85445 [Trichoderma longibrachiatum ATCC 18648]